MKRCQSSLDVEVVVRGENLGIGVFAPEEMMSLNGATEMMTEMKNLLEEIAEIV